MDISRIISNSVFEEKLGKIHTADIRNLTFINSSPEDSDVMISTANISTVIVCPLSSEGMQEANASRRMEFFREGIEKIQVLAVEKYAGIKVSPYYVAKALSAVKIYVDKAISGDPKYLRYMEEIDQNLDTLENLSKCLVISLSGSVANINKGGEKIEYGLYWSASVVEKHWDEGKGEDDIGHTSVVEAIGGY